LIHQSVTADGGIDSAALSSSSPGPRRGLCAVVEDELQRAFCSAQFGNDRPSFVHYGVPPRVLEAGG
jgi:hypothetical protein